MPKTIRVILTIDIGADDKLNTNISFEEVATLGDVIAAGTALGTANGFVKGQLGKYLDANGDVHRDDWEEISSAKVFLHGNENITEES